MSDVSAGSEFGEVEAEQAHDGEVAGRCMTDYPSVPEAVEADEYKHRGYEEGVAVNEDVKMGEAYANTGIAVEVARVGEEHRMKGLERVHDLGAAVAVLGVGGPERSVRPVEEDTGLFLADA